MFPLDKVAAMKSTNLALRFLLELCILAALGLWGFQTGQSALWKIVLGLGAPLLAAGLWWGFVAPRASRRLPDPARLGLELLIFGAAIAALFAAGRPALGCVFGGLAALNLGLMFAWHQRGM
jgi:hypothetical protein